MADAGDGRAEFDLVIQSEQIHAGFGGIDQVGNREMGRNRNRNKGKKTKEEKGRGQNDLRLNSATRSKYVGKLVLQQLAAADFVLPTKLDLVESKERAVQLEWLGQQIPGVCLIEPQDILCAVSASGAWLMADDPEVHAERFCTYTLRESRPVDLSRMQQAFASWPDAIIRAKGFIYAQQDPEVRYLLQSVGKRRSIERQQPWGPSSPKTEIVFIWRRGWLDASEVSNFAELLCRYQTESEGEKNHQIDR